MVRDWELVREILVKLESLEPQEELGAEDIEGFDNRAVNHHLQIMMEAGLIEVIESQLLDRWEGKATRLTWDGHEFLDQIRSETVWRKVKDRLSKEGLSASFHAIKTLADYFVKQAIT
jgi:hypothetical protein